MRSTWAVCKREFAGFFTTPAGYVVMGTYALITGLGFTYSFVSYCLISESPSLYGHTSVPDFEEWFLSPFLVFCGTLVMFIGPLITMRLLAEERNKGTMELLLTHPLRDRDIIFGKYGASLAMLIIMMAVVAIYMVVANYFAAVETAVLVFGLLTMFLMGAAFFAMGLFISALCNTQISAGTGTFGLFFLFFILGTEAVDLDEANPAPQDWPDGPRAAVGLIYRIFRTLVTELPLDAHAKDMAQGVVQPYDIAYYVLFSAFFLFLTFRVLESRKWRA